MAQREFTGWHAAAVFVGAFGVIIGVNLVLAFSAVETFPGLETKNSYVESQLFDRQRQAQEALGWSIYASARDGEVQLDITDKEGNPVEVAKLHAVLGRATHVRDDVEPNFEFNGTAYVAPVHLGPGNWNIRMTARAENGVEFRQRVILHVRG